MSSYRTIRQILILFTLAWLVSACSEFVQSEAAKPTPQIGVPSPGLTSPTLLQPTQAQTQIVVETLLPLLSPTLQVTDAIVDDLSIYALVGIAPGEELIMRRAADTDSLPSGTLPFDAIGIRITGSPLEASGHVWVPVQWGELHGWIDQAHLARMVGTLEPAVIEIARRVVWAIKLRDFEFLSKTIHPQKGVRFSPYSYVHLAERDLVFSAGQVAGFATDTERYLWGSYDGSGAPISLTPREFFDEFVYDVDFAHPEQLGLNQVIGSGNTINNITEAYPQAVFVEFYFSGFDAKYEGMDWRSLRLVLEKSEGSWYLIGIIHDEWTI